MNNKKMDFKNQVELGKFKITYNKITYYNSYFNYSLFKQI